MLWASWDWRNDHPAGAQYKISTAIPPSVPAPDEIDPPFGTLHLTDGFPDEESTQKLYGNLDFQHAVQAYLLVSQWANRKGILEWGPPNTTVPIFDSRHDSGFPEIT